MGSPFDLAQLDKNGAQAWEYFFQHVLSWSMVAQIVVIGGALLLARKVSGAMRAWLTRQQAQYAAHPEAGTDLAVLLDFVKVIDAFIALILMTIGLSEITFSKLSLVNSTVAMAAPREKTRSVL